MARSIRLAAILALLTMSFGPAALSAPVGTAFTYQGQLERSNVPANSSCNWQFSLWDAVSAGTQIGTTQTLSGVTVVDGLFTVNLDFGAGAFNGDARWLQIAVQCTGDGGFTTLAPRQVLNPAPYALFSLAGSTGLSLPYSGTANVAGSAFRVHNQNSSFGTGLEGQGGAIGTYGVTYASPTGIGVYGEAHYPSGTIAGVTGRAFQSPDGRGVAGYGAARGVYGESESGWAVNGESTNGWGVVGRAYGSGGQGVFGQGLGSTSTGVAGRCDGANGQGVFGYAASTAIGVLGISEGNDGVSAGTNAANKSGVFGWTGQASSFGGFFTNFAGGVALRADGKAQVRILEILGGADLVESFETGSGDGNDAKCDAGTVVVIDEERSGRLTASSASYDRKVAGVVSGAGGIEPGIRLGQEGVLDGDTPVAMAGRVYVKCSAENGPIRPGDRLTTSSMTGHAMRATDQRLSDGAVIGKAMSSLDAGTGLVLVLVNLQ